MGTIMIIEDEFTISDLLETSLKSAGHTALRCADGDKAIQFIKENNPDIILLDVMLQGKYGLAFIKEFESLDIPVIFLTEKESIDDKVAELKLSADDYIVKPFVTAEVLTKIDTVLKNRQKNENTFKLGTLEVHFDERTVYLNGTRVELTTKEFDLLDVLISNKNTALSRDKLLDIVWGLDYSGETRTVDVHIQRLRGKLDLEGKIKTVYGIGYRLEVR